MSWVDGGEYYWTDEQIEKEAPETEGVYGIWNSQRVPLYIGRGNIRERLMSHWNSQNNADPCIWKNTPYKFCFEIMSNSEARRAELLRKSKARCIDPSPANPVPNSF